MSEEPVSTRVGRGALVQSLSREDLDLYSVEELGERIAALSAEINRAKTARDRKQLSKSAADALFSRRAD